MFHAGVVRALEQRFGWSSDLAAKIIGTSAGSSVAAGLRLGEPIDDIVHELDRPPSPEDMEQFRVVMESRPWQWRPLQPSLLRELLPGGGGAGLALSGVLPRGRYPTWPLARLVDRLESSAWPDGLWITATDISDAGLAVFGRDTTAVSVGDAIEASSAVPGLMEPKQIGGVFYVDGGAVSPTHADLAIDAGVDLAIVSSPMTRPGRRPLGVLARRRLTEEVAVLESSGVAAVVVEPPEGTDTLFRDYPRRYRRVGHDIRLMGEAALEIALITSGFGPGDLG